MPYTIHGDPLDDPTSLQKTLEKSEDERRRWFYMKLSCSGCQRDKVVRCGKETADALFTVTG